METNIGIGFSQDPNAFKAALAAALQAKAQTRQDKAHLAIIFSTPHYNPREVIPAVSSSLAETRIIGCSTIGIILPTRIASRGIAVAAIHSDVIQFGIGAMNDLSSMDIRQAGINLARNTTIDFGQHRRHAFLFWADGSLVNYSLFIRGLQEILGNAFPILGAGASQASFDQPSCQYYQNQHLTNAVAGVLIGGGVHLGLGNRHGWKPLGKPRALNKTEGAVIKTIDKKPAAHIYEEYFGLAAHSLKGERLQRLAMLYPLGIYMEPEEEYLLRNAVDILEDGSMVCQGEVPEGAEVHIMISNKDSCKQAAVNAALEIKNSFLAKPPELVIIFESLSRQKLLGRSAFNEIQIVKDIIGSQVPLIGMYSSSEVSPFHSMNYVKRTYLQNKTILIIGIG